MSAARLHALAGPCEGRSFPLADETAIGRGPANAIILADPAVSRQHCLIRRTETGFEVEHVGSANPTRVNGVPVLRRLLSEGDQIEAGRSVFLLAFDRDAEAGVGDEDEGELETMAMSADAPAGLPDAVVLNRLLSVAAGFTHQRTAAALASAVLPAMQELLAAEAAVVFESADPPRALAASDPHLAASRSLLRSAVEAGRPVLGVARGPSAGASLLRLGRGCAIAAPASRDSGLGFVLYAERRQSVAGERDLQLLGMLAQLVSGPLAAALRRDELEAENRRLRHDALAASRILGESQAMQDVYRFIGRVARVDSTVLIEGESGTGKELVARSIHAASPRAERPFAAVNCAALTETLLESELFGHERGAFTGAVAQRRGRLEEAAGGTFFLDEVGEMPLAMQAKLLRVLQEREFERVGGNRVIRCDVRVIAATNRVLEDEVRAGRFREDLWYRLRVLTLRTPPLRERTDDIQLLAHHFLRHFAAQAKRPVQGVSPAAIALLRSYDWPGNVRELQNAMERAVVLAEDSILHPEDFAEALSDRAAAAQSDLAAAASGDWHARLVDAKRRIVRDALRESGGIHNEAARTLGVHPNNLRRLIRSLGI